MFKKMLLLALSVILSLGLVMNSASDVQAQAMTKLYIQVRAFPQWWNNWMKDTNHSCRWGSLQNVTINLTLKGTNKDKTGGIFYRTAKTDSSGNIILDVWQNQTVELLAAEATSAYQNEAIRMKSSPPAVIIGTKPVYYMDVEMVSKDLPDEKVTVTGRIVYPALSLIPLPYKKFTITGCGSAISVTTTWNGTFSVSLWPKQTVVMNIPGGAGLGNIRYRTTVKPVDIPKMKKPNIGDIAVIPDWAP